MLWVWVNTNEREGAVELVEGTTIVMRPGTKLFLVSDSDPQKLIFTIDILDKDWVNIYGVQLMRVSLAGTSWFNLSSKVHLEPTNV